MRTVRRTGLVAQVTEQLRGHIRTGAWAVGTRIPTEPILAELTGTGRNTVREAVQALVHSGLLERRQGSGTYVVATSEVGSALGTYFADAHEQDVLELRQALDVTAAVLAAQRRTRADAEHLTELFDARMRAWADPRSAAALAADVALHRAIVAASHNAVYLEFYDSLIPVIEETIRRRVEETGAGFHDEHRELVLAVVAGDPGRAAAAALAMFGELRGSDA